MSPDNNASDQDSNQKGFVKALVWIAIGVVFFILSGFQFANGEPIDTTSGFSSAMDGLV